MIIGCRTLDFVCKSSYLIVDGGQCCRGCPTGEDGVPIRDLSHQWKYLKWKFLILSKMFVTPTAKCQSETIGVDKDTSHINRDSLHPASSRRVRNQTKRQEREFTAPSTG